MSLADNGFDVLTSTPEILAVTCNESLIVLAATIEKIRVSAFSPGTTYGRVRLLRTLIKSRSPELKVIVLFSILAGASPVFPK